MLVSLWFLKKKKYIKFFKKKKIKALIYFKIIFLIKKNYKIIKKKIFFISRKNFKLLFFFKKKYNNYLEIGSGNFLIPKLILKKYKHLRVVLTDFYKDSIKNLFLGLKNISNKRIKIKKKNIFKNLKKKFFNLINFNPPYISYKNRNLNSKNLKFEKLNSLTDFKNGFFFIKKFLMNLKKYLKKKSKIVLEINKKQKKYIKNFYKKNYLINEKNKKIFNK